MGEVFGRYELLRRIGVGGMAEVFMARRFGAEGFVKEVVIKRILPAFNEDPDFVGMFINEARLAALLQHTNIVQIFDFNHVDNAYYIAMEWVDGADLKRLFDLSRRRNLPIPIGVAVHIGVEALKGLHYAHSRRERGRPMDLVHRDISPHNLLISFNGEVKITDFGIAKAAAIASATQSGIIKGKLAYMSPEQAAGQPLDARSDLFSLSIVLWELLAGERLYMADTESGLFAKVREAMVRPIRPSNPAVSEELEEVVIKMLAFSPDDRYQRAADALGALSRFTEVEEALEMAEYLKKLMPEEVGRERKGETAVMEPVGPLPVTYTEAQLSLPTRSGSVLAGGLETQQEQDSEVEPALAKTILAFGAGGDEGEGAEPRPEPAAGGESGESGEHVEEVSPSPVDRGRSLRWPVVAGTVLAVVFGVAGWWLAGRRSGSEGKEDTVTSVRVETRPPGAAVYVDEVRVGVTPLDVRGSRGNRVSIVARLGKRSAQRTLVLGEQDRLLLPLSEEIMANDGSVADGHKAAPDGPEAVPDRAAAMPDRPLAHRPRPAAHAVRKEERKALQPRGTGTIDIHVFPWAKVRIDGRDVGQTPLIGYRLPEGPHTVEIYNTELNKREKIRVKISAGARAKPVRREWR